MEIGRIERPPEPEPIDYNPYNPVQVDIGGQTIDGRPFEFDSEAVDGFKNAMDRIIRPTKIATVCPHCGQGIVVEVHQYDKSFAILPEGASIIAGCPECGAGAEPELPPEPEPPTVADPFCNPVAVGRISEYDLDKTMIRPDDIANDDKTVAERVPEVIETLDEPVEFGAPEESPLDLGEEPD